VRGFKEEGTTTTPFDMVVRNDLDRFHLVIDVVDRVDRVKKLGSKGAYLKQLMRDKRVEHQQYICEHGEDMPEVGEWQWRATQEANVTPGAPRAVKGKKVKVR
jgi:xylulose-5-phosphate/fructose-6-phosphate phosphoketolase